LLPLRRLDRRHRRRPCRRHHYGTTSAANIATALAMVSDCCEHNVVDQDSRLE
jgi:hypothetical protein